MIKAKLKSFVQEAVKKARNQSGCEALPWLDIPIVIEQPGLAEYGDYTSSIALKLAAKTEISALQLAEIIAVELEELLTDIAEAKPVAPGYINFLVQKPFLQEILKEINSQGESYGRAKDNHSLLKINALSLSDRDAGQANHDNPSFYIQHTHARCCSIVRMAIEPMLDIETKTEHPAPVNPTQWQEWLELYKNSTDVFANLFDSDPRIFTQQKKLIVTLSLFSEEVEKAILARKPEKLLQYALDVADDFQAFYETSRIITTNTEGTRARLGLITATKQVLSNTLNIIGLNAPEQM